MSILTEAHSRADFKVLSLIIQNVNIKSSTENDFQNMPFGETITSPKCSGNCLEVMLGSKVNQCPASHIFFCIRYPREVLILGLYFPQS